MIIRLIKVSLILLIASTALSQPLEFGFSSGSLPAPGETFDVDVSVSSFENLISFQVGIFWDSTVMRVDTVPFVSTELPDFTRDASITLPDDIPTPIRGLARVTWLSFAIQPNTLPDETVLFTLRFSMIGDPCDETSLTIGDPELPFLRIEAIDGDFNEIGAISDDFPVMIPGTNCEMSPPEGCQPGEVELIFPDLNVNVGENVCIPMTVANFDSISGFQLSMVWDSTVLLFTGAQNSILTGTSPNSFNANNSDSGILSFFWIDNSTNRPETHPDGTVLFELCFDVIGNAGTSSTINVQNSPTMIEVSNFDGEVLPTCQVEGTITVINGGVDLFGLTAQSVTASTSMTCVDITADNFDSIVLMQFALDWDDSILEYNSITNLNQALPLFSSDFNQEGDTLRFSWNDFAPRDLPDGTVLFTICFDVLPGNCGATTTIDFVALSDNPLVDIEIARPSSNGDILIPFSLESGIVNVTFGCVDAPVLNPVTTALLCNGDNNGVIDVMLSGGTPPYSCNWGGPISVMTSGHTTNCLQENLAAGTYFITVTDNMGNSSTSTVELSEPDAIIIDGSTTPDSGSGGSISVNLSGGTPPYNQEFNPPLADLNNVEQGTYTLLVTDSNQCQQTRIFTVGSSDVMVRIDGVFSATCGNDGRICISCTGGTGNYNLATATPPLTFDPNQGCFLNVGGGTYNITCTDTNGTTGSTTVTVSTVAPTPLSCQVFNIVPAVCGGLGGTFDVACMGGCPPYDIQVGISPNGAKVPFDPNGTYIAEDYVVCIEDENGTVRTINFNIPEVGNGLIEVETTVVSAATCTENGSVLTNISGGCNPTCRITDNNNSSNSFACSDGMNVSLPAGSYTLTAVDSQGQNASDSFTIESETPELSVSINDILDSPCNGMDGSVSLNISGGCGSSTCSIDIGSTGTNVQSCNIVGGRISAPIGNHIIIISDNNSGQSISTPVAIEISDDAFDLMLVGITSNSIDIMPIGGQAPYSYQWVLPDNTVVNTEDLTDLTLNGTYSVVAIDAMGCAVSLSTVWPNSGVLSINIDNNNISSSLCASGTNCTGEIVGNVQNGVAPYDLTISDQFGNSESFMISQLGTFTLSNICGGSYSVSVLDAGGNVFDFNSPVVVPSPDPIMIETVNVDCSDAVNPNGSISVSVSGGSGLYEYMWTPSLPIAGPSNDNLSPGTYLLTVTDINDCDASVSIEVDDCEQLDDCGIALQVITPNGDGVNENLIITCSEMENNTIAIYDRYGRRVFSDNNYSNNWNGVDDDGQELQEGAYHWVYTVDGEINKGTVTLLRD